MPTTADVVVAGGGHKRLIAACYLAKAGYEVLVLEARATPGGAAATEELTLPGSHFDSCSTGHTLIQPNPVLRDDELGLKSEYGLEYVSPDPIAHVVFPDGESLTHWLDLDRTLDYWTRTLGVGPFFALRNLSPEQYRYRGQPSPAPVVSPGHRTRHPTRLTYAPWPNRRTPSGPSTSRRGPRSPRWWSATTASLAAAGAWGSTPRVSARKPPPR